MKDSTAIIVVVILGAILILPSVFTIGTNFLKDIGDWIKGGWGNGEIQVTEEMVLGCKVEYVDGTTEIVTPETKSFHVLPLAVYLKHEEISKIWWEVWIKLDWDGDLNRVSVEGFLSIDIDESDLPTEPDDDLIPLTVTIIEKQKFASAKTTVDKNEWMLYNKYFLEAQTIQDAVDKDGLYDIIASVDVTITANFEDGTIDELQREASSDLTVEITVTGIKAIDVKVGLE